MRQKGSFSMMMAGATLLAATMLAGCSNPAMEVEDAEDKGIVFSIDNEDEFRVTPLSGDSTQDSGESQTLTAVGGGIAVKVTEQDYSSSGQQPFTRGAQVTASSLGAFGVSAAIRSTGAAASDPYKAYWHDRRIPATTGKSGYDWPGADYRLAFYAYYPYGHPALTISSWDEKGCPIYRYSVPTEIISQADVMTTQAMDVPGDANAPVGLSFRHHCAAVRFVFHNNGNRTTNIKSIAIEGVRYSGTLHKGTWTLSDKVNTRSENPFSLTCNTSIAGGKSVYLTRTATVFMMLPQELPTTAKMRIITENGIVEARLVGSWMAGKTYTYDIYKVEDSVLYNI